MTQPNTGVKRTRFCALEHEYTLEDPKIKHTYSYKDEDKIDENLMCSFICHGPLVNPVTHSCNNCFCFECIKQAGYKCPVCAIGKETDYSKVKIRIVLRMLDNLPVICNNCNTETQRGDLIAHFINRCPILCSRGCGLTITRATEKKHATICDNVPVLCSAADEASPKNENIGITLSNRRIVIGGNDGTIRICNVDTGECEKQLKDGDDLIYSIIQLFDGRIASGSNDNTIRIWNVESGQCDKILKGDSAGVYSIVELRDGRIVSGGWDKTIRVWNVETGECEKQFTGHTKYINSIIELIDGRIASGSRDQTIRIWNVETGECEKELAGHSAPIVTIVELRDGRIASKGEDGTIRIWNIFYRFDTYKSLRGHTNLGRSPVIQLWNGRIASGDDDGTIRIWNIETGECEKQLTVRSTGSNSIIRVIMVYPSIMSRYC